MPARKSALEEHRPPAGKLLLRASLVWVGMLCLAFVNGAFRALVLTSTFGIPEQLAHQLSVGTAIILFTLLLASTWSWLGIKTRASAWRVGVAWALVTALFEACVLNMWMGGLSLQQVLTTYNVFQGELWPLLLLWLALLPFLLQWRSRAKHPRWML